MNSTEEMSQFSKLVAVLEETLEATNQTKQILRTSCDEIRQLLVGWRVSEENEGDVQLPECTCTTVSTCDEPEEMAKDIEEALEYAQKLRKTTALRIQTGGNTIVRNKTSGIIPNKPKIEAVTSNISKSRAQASTRNVPIAINKDKKSNIPCRGCSKSPSEVQHKVRSSFVPSSAKPRSSSTASKLRTCTSFQTTYQKDFSLRYNRIPVRSAQQNVRYKITEAKTEHENVVALENGKINDLNCEDMCSINSNYISASGTITGVELEKMIGRNTIKTNPKSDLDSLKTDIKIDLNSFKSNMKTVLGSINANNKCHLRIGSCALHSSAAKYMEPQTTVSLHEAIDLKGVPSELVAVLKPYHQFVTNLHTRDARAETSKSHAAGQQFVYKLTSSNQIKWDDASYEPLAGLYSQYLSSFGEASSMDRKDRCLDHKLAKIQENFEYLESICHKILNLDESAPPDAYSMKTSPRGVYSASGEGDFTMKSGWTLNGVWNQRSRSTFNGMMQVQCIRYRDAQQWARFKENLQKIQQLQLQLQVLDILSSDIIPGLWSLDLNDPAFPALYKTCSALRNLATLSIPVLMKT